MRWIRPKLGSFDKSSLKREAQRFFGKICLSPILWQPFKVTVPSCRVIGNNLIANCAVRRTPLRLHLWFYIVQGLANLKKNLGINCQLRNRLVFIVIFNFLLVKAMMNAPHICKLRKLYRLTSIGQGAMVLTMRLHFFIFQLPQAEQRPLHTCQLRRGCVPNLDRRINNCKLRNNLIQVCCEFSPPTAKLVA